MLEFKQEVEKVKDTFDFVELDDERVDWLFAGFYTELDAHNPPRADVNFIVYHSLGREAQRLLFRETDWQCFEDPEQFYTALILAAHPEYKVVRVAQRDYFIVKPEDLQKFLDSKYFAGYSANCKVEVL